MKRFEERGVRINPFLLDYIVDENLNLFTQGNEKIINARAIMSNIDINELKKELYKLLLANKYIYSNSFFSADTLETVCVPVFEIWLNKANSVSDVERIINKYYDKDAFTINRYIEKALKQMINSKQYNDNWLLKPELSVRFKRLIKKN